MAHTPSERDLLSLVDILKSTPIGPARDAVMAEISSKIEWRKKAEQDDGDFPGYVGVSDPYERHKMADKPHGPIRAIPHADFHALPGVFTKAEIADIEAAAYARGRRQGVAEAYDIVSKAGDYYGALRALFTYEPKED